MQEAADLILTPTQGVSADNGGGGGGRGSGSGSGSVVW